MKNNIIICNHKLIFIIYNVKTKTKNKIQTWVGEKFKAILGWKETWTKEIKENKKKQ